MGLPLLFATPLVAGATLLALNFVRPRSAQARRDVMVPGRPLPLTAEEQRAFESGLSERRVALLERQETVRGEGERARFQETQLVSRARFGIDEERLREDIRFRMDEAARRADEARERVEAVRAVAAERLEELRLQVQERRADADERAQTSLAIAREQGVSARFQAFAAGLPEGFSAGINPSGFFIPIPPGSLVSARDVAAGFEPLPFAPTQTRIVQIAPGVTRIFVG